MASPGKDDKSYILSVQIQDGKGFGPDSQAVAVAATFAGETKLTPYSVGRDSHVWNSTLQWRLTLDHFRRLTSLGQKDCKLVLTTRDGTKLGWFLVDVRAAKLQAQYKKDEGAWMTLSGAKKGEVPQVHVLALFYEDRPGGYAPPDITKSPARVRPVRRQPATSGAAADSGADAAGSTQPEGDSALAAEASRARDAGWEEASGQPAPTPHPTTGLPSFGSPGRNPADDGPFRHFALTVDVRSFQSSKRLPLSSASVYVQAVLPTDLIELVVLSGYRLPSKLAPLRSHPAVDMPRGAEGAVPNAHGTLEFSAGVVQLARVLAREPRISVEAWHKERFRTDMLLGAGSVPLSPLLQGAWVDGYAPLFAIVASSVGGELREERVQMGMLRVVLSLEDKGPAEPPEVAAAKSRATAEESAASPSLMPRTNPYDEEASVAAALAGPPAGGTSAGGGGASAAAAEEDAALAIREVHPAPSVAAAAAAAAAAAGLPAHAVAAPPELRLPPPAELAGGSRVGAAAGLQGSPEFEAVWELEVWKKAEEARWRSELREREAQRMMVLESEWRRRERAREAEISALKAEYLTLEDKTQQVLGAAEARERRIVAAEEALLRRRKELEREHSARMSEAEAAVRRLQVECEHQLDIERDRNAELVRRVAMLEERLAASEARGLAVENEFADFRAACRATPEAELARQLAEAREAAKAADARAAKAAKAKQGYKEQVRKLADQLASLQRRRQRGEDPSGLALSSDSGGAGAGRPMGLGPSSSVPSLRAAAEEQARYAASQQQELAAMRSQLQAIKAAALAQLSPSSSPRAGAAAGPGSGGPAAAGSEAGQARAGTGSAPAAGGAAAAGASAGRGREEAEGDVRQSTDQERQGRTTSSRAQGASSSTHREGGAPAAQAQATGSTNRVGPGEGPHTREAWGPDTTPMHPPNPSNPPSSSSSSGPADRSAAPQDGSGGWGQPQASQAGRWVQAPAGRGPGAGPDRGHQPSPAASAPPPTVTPMSAASDARTTRSDGGLAPTAAPPGVWPGGGSRSTGGGGVPAGSRHDQGPALGRLGAVHEGQQEGEEYAGEDWQQPLQQQQQPELRPPSSAPYPRRDGGAGYQQQPHAPQGSSGQAPGAWPGAGYGYAPDPQDRYSYEYDSNPPASPGEQYSQQPERPSYSDPYPQPQQRYHSYDGPPPQGEHSYPQSGAPRGVPAYPPSVRELVGPNADLAEIQRLTRRKMELLQSGSYGMGDTVVQLLDERIQALMAATAGLPVPGGR